MSVARISCKYIDVQGYLASEICNVNMYVRVLCVKLTQLPSQIS